MFACTEPRFVVRLSSAPLSIRRRQDLKKLAAASLVTVAPLRVIHLAFSGAGGAGRAAKRASLACRNAGMDSVFASCNGSDPGQGEILLKTGAPPSGSVAAALVDLQWGHISANRVGTEHSLFSVAYPGVDIAALPAVISADIIHLHWPAWTVTPAQIRGFMDAGKTVFLTLHDMIMFTGGCHYSGDCAQFKTSCMKCPQITDRFGLVAASFEDKLAAYGGDPRLNVITLCNWMEGLATSSKILAGSTFHRIPNPIETDIFAPLSSERRRELRQALGIGDGDLALLFGNFDNAETRKGSAILHQALELLSADARLTKDCLTKDRPTKDRRVFLLGFGRDAHEGLTGDFIKVDVGKIDKDDVLAGIYGLADLFCFPSIEDNYPNSIIEAAACGTPSVVFATGGMRDMVEHRVTGIQVHDVGSSTAFAEGIATFAETFHGNSDMRSQCRKSVLQTNGMDGIGQKLAAAYASALGRPMSKATKAKNKPSKTKAVQAINVAKPTAKEGTSIASLSASIQSGIQLAHDVRMGAAFARFPLNRLIKSTLTDPGPLPVISYARPRTPRRIRLMTVRTFHEHHSAFSGPYQFLRHLPDDYDQTNITVPIGSDLVPPDLAQPDLQGLGHMLGLDGFAPQGNAWMGEWDILQRLRREPYDIVHFLDGELGGWLASRVPASFFPLGRPIFATMLHQPLSSLMNMVSVPALARFDLISTVSEAQATGLRGLLPNHRIDAVPHGVDVDFFSPPKRRPQRPAEKPFRLLAVGHWLRDYALAIKAFEIVIARGFQIEYRIVSHNLGLDKVPGFVTHLSGLTDQQLLQEYRAADLLFMPLTDATANNALLEAMSCGTAVVTTNVGAVQEYVAQICGKTADPDPDACADAIVALLQDHHLRARSAANARKHALHFDWRRIAERHHSIYRSVLAQTAGNRYGT